MKKPSSVKFFDDDNKGDKVELYMVDEFACVYTPQTAARYRCPHKIRAIAAWLNAVADWIEKETP